MGRSDEFHWVTDAEPHATRRRAILAEHGEKVRKLYGYDHSTAVQVRGPLRFDQRLKRWALLVRADGSLLFHADAPIGVSMDFLWMNETVLKTFVRPAISVASGMVSAPPLLAL